MYMRCYQVKKLKFLANQGFRKKSERNGRCSKQARNDCQSITGEGDNSGWFHSEGRHTDGHWLQRATPRWCWEYISEFVMAVEHNVSWHHVLSLIVRQKKTDRRCFNWCYRKYTCVGKLKQSAKCWRCTRNQMAEVVQDYTGLQFMLNSQAAEL